MLSYVLYSISPSEGQVVVDSFDHVLEAAAAARVANRIDPTRRYCVDYVGEPTPAEEFEFVMSQVPY
jgi:hypothetical protein